MKKIQYAKLKNFPTPPEETPEKEEPINMNTAHPLEEDDNDIQEFPPGWGNGKPEAAPVSEMVEKIRQQNPEPENCLPVSALPTHSFSLDTPELENFKREQHNTIAKQVEIPKSKLNKHTSGQKEKGRNKRD